MIFVFGSNRSGIHGAGAAAHAHKNLGAEWGVGEGPTGECYALPTKGHKIQDLSKTEIKRHVDKFLEFARDVPNDFKVTCVGTGLAVWNHEDIAPMFKGAPDNCYFDTLWEPWLGDSVSYWGTF